MLWQSHSFRAADTVRAALHWGNLRPVEQLASTDIVGCPKVAALPPHSKFGVLWQSHSFRAADTVRAALHWGNLRPVEQLASTDISWLPESGGFAAALQITLQ